MVNGLSLLLIHAANAEHAIYHLGCMRGERGLPVILSIAAKLGDGIFEHYSSVDEDHRMVQAES